MPSNKNIKHKLLINGTLKNKCYICGQLPEWNGKPLVLQLDHINGINDDNRIENLRILCPHCHTQTETWGTKRFKKKRPNCLDCQIKITRGSVRCFDCNVKVNNSQLILHQFKPKINWPSPDFILKTLEEKSYFQLARDLNVTDTAIRKYLLRKGFVPPKKLNGAHINRKPDTDTNREARLVILAAPLELNL